MIVESLACIQFFSVNNGAVGFSIDGLQSIFQCDNEAVTSTHPIVELRRPVDVLNVEE